MKTRAFTQLELLVVIAIIAILAALLLGVIGNGRKAGQTAQCVQNLRQLAAANLLYAHENGGRYCFAQDIKNNLRWHGVRTNSGKPFDGAKGPLSPYLGKEARVKICPEFQKILSGTKSFENGSGGYGYNEIYIGGTPADPWAGELIANVPNPVRTLMFADTGMSRATGVQEYPFCEPPQWVSPVGSLAGALSPSVHFRHGGVANVVWCDGHVTAEAPRTLGKKNVYGGDDKKNRIGWFGPARDNGWWNPAFVPGPGD